MKKIFVSIYCILFALLLTGCMNNNVKGFVNPIVLIKSDLTDLVEPSHTNKYQRESLGFCYFNSSQEEFKNYAKEIYDYLINKSFPYFGFPGDELNSLFGANGTYELISSIKLSDHYEELYYYGELNTISYTFIFGEKLNSNNEVLSDIMVRLSFKVDGTFDNGYNTSLEVRNNQNLMMSFIYIPKNIEFIQIEEAYNQGFLSKTDIQEIADLLNGVKNKEDIFNKGYEVAVRKAYLEYLIKREPDAEIKDISVSFHYQNKYGYIVTITDKYSDYPDVIKKISIDDIVITYSGPRPFFIKLTDE